jgi:hypothetical protein
MTRFAYPPPSDGKPFRLTMGLREVEPGGWLEMGTDLDRQLLERNRHIDDHADIVFAQLPGYEGPCLEFGEQLLADLDRFHRDTHLVEGASAIHRATGFLADLDNEHPFIALGRVIAEDLCLMSLVDGRWTLTAGLVIFPSRWNLLEKIGRDVDAIHAPVPGYDQSLIHYMAPVFDRLTRRVWRLNWTLHATDELHQIERSSETAPAEGYFWRTERQTLTRTGDHVLFTIRNRAEPFLSVLDDPERAALFAATLESMPAESRAYKGLSEDLDEVIAFLRG